jgi:DNA-directed RNA polymerase II subunit RPB3
MSTEVMTGQYLNPMKKSYINKKNELFGFTEEINNELFLPIRLTNVDVSVANALRRIFMFEIPTIGFEQSNVNVLKNTSEYHREVLIGRIGFIVLNNEMIKDYNLDDLLFAICDQNDPIQPLKNTSSQILKVNLYQHMYIQQVSTKIKQNNKLFLPYNSLLLTLNPGQEIHVVMKPSIGIGLTSPIWQSSITMYKFETPTDSTDQLETNEEQMAYFGHEHKQPKSIILTIESIGKIQSNTIVVRGIQVLKQKLENFKQHLQIHEKSELVSIEIDENIPNLVKIKIVNDDHTLGNILQYACLNKLKQLIKETIGGNQNNQNNQNTELSPQELELLCQSLSAYRKPHPLDNYIEFNARTPLKTELVFPAGQFDEVNNPTIRLILLAVEDVQNLCDQLEKDTASLF